MARSIEQQTITKAAWRLAPIAFLGLVLSFLDRVNLSFAALTLNRDLGLDQSVYGFAAGVFFFGYFIFEVPSNLILERIGARTWLARIMITWGVVTCITAFVATAWQLNVLRFLLGLAEAGYSPGVLFYFCLWFPKRHRGRMFAYFMLAQPVGAIIGAPMAAALLGMDGILGFKGWQWLFLTEGVPAIILSFIIYRALPSTPAEAKWLTADERVWLTTTLAAERAEVEKTGVMSLWRALRSPRLLLLSLGYGVYASCFWCVVFFLPQIVKATGVTVTMASLLSAVPYIAAGIATFINGRIADRSNALEHWMFAFTLIAAAALASMAYLGTSSSTWSLIAATVATTGILGFLPLFWGVMPRFLTGRAAAGGFAFVNSLASLGGFGGPFAFGWIAGLTGGYSGGLWTFSVVALLCGFIFLHSARLASPVLNAPQPAGAAAS
jgi:ACS family tartrate transporter-like MFS transporter